MHVTVFGGTGGTGVECIKQLLAADHSVAALVRSPEKLSDEIKVDPNFTMHVGNVLEEKECEKALAESNIVIVALGGNMRAPADQKSICRTAQPVINKAVNAACADARVIAVSSLGTGDSYQHINWMTRKFVDWVLYEQIAHKEVQEASIKDTIRTWTIVRPGGLTDGASIGKWEASRTVSGGRISRADVAKFIIQECLTGDKWQNRAVSIVSK
ncbi:hypothetical protein SARC_02869 [Sphaeroforma arctica JP610]|uniref:NAD(P)-binding domain-containing protein n=1 Tax=Sphaeroforma arctica JP610 TaxID=667725 RepID=A0A0L0G7D2_9EUKA|nr:hypothetical protein SARC_02869 [Sphaeroforma arctica JP610]KNC84915.1 hypothetical protein SARC_02869 [Sphaeroforma arctica JP610]|eukprot:XP_014158817.1 hypothetical protein SARC_02869 [Sphaeroforma arctica JP610]